VKSIFCGIIETTPIFKDAVNKTNHFNSLDAMVMIENIKRSIKCSFVNFYREKRNIIVGRFKAPTSSSKMP